MYNLILYVYKSRLCHHNSHISKSHLLTLCNSFSNLKKNDAGNNDGDELNFQSRHDIVDKKKYSIL